MLVINLKLAHSKHSACPQMGFTILVEARIPMPSSYAGPCMCRKFMRNTSKSKQCICVMSGPVLEILENRSNGDLAEGGGGM